MKKIKEIEILKDQQDVIDELIRIEKYKNKLMGNQQYNFEIQNFINELVNKYRYKIEVMNYYSNMNGTDDVNENQYNTLNTLEEMILQYSLIKFSEKFYKNLINK